MVGKANQGRPDPTGSVSPLCASAYRYGSPPQHCLPPKSRSLITGATQSCWQFPRSALRSSGIHVADLNDVPFALEPCQHDVH
jgi:hypothetical protein